MTLWDNFEQDATKSKVFTCEKEWNLEARPLSVFFAVGFGTHFAT